MLRARSATVVAAVAVLGGVSVLALRAWSAAAPRVPPAWRTNPNGVAAEVTITGDVSHITQRQAAQTLVPDTTPPAAGARLLWYHGRAVQSSQQTAVVVDDDGRLLRVDSALSAYPLAVASRPDAWRSAMLSPSGTMWLTDDSHRIVRVNRDGVPRDVASTEFEAAQPVAAGAEDQVWLVRSTAQLTGAPHEGRTPLLMVMDSLGQLRRRLGTAQVPAHVLLEPMANAGFLAVHNQVVFFAPFIRDQLVAMTERGDTLWVASRGLAHTSGDPRFEVRNGSVVIDYHPVNLGLVIGPDSLLYLLSTRDAEMSGTRLDVFDPETGALLRTAILDRMDPTLAVTRDGRVHLLPGLQRSGTRDRMTRPAVARIDLSLLAGGRVTSESLHGRLTLMNFWASWCGPCRAEMPALDSLQQRLTGQPVAFVSINEDADRDAAAAFMQRGRYRFPVALGGAGMHERFGAAGLPFTILVDADGREVARWSGYAGPTQTTAIAAAITAELRDAPAAAMPASHQHRH